MPNENLRRYMDTDSLEALWNDTGQLISSLVESAAQDISDVAVQQAQAAADDSIRDAIEAVEDISELVVPLMSDVVRGGAKLGTGLRVDDGKLSLGDIVTDSHDGPIYSVDAEGWSEQASTTGKNLYLVERLGYETVNQCTASVVNQVLTITTSGTTPYYNEVAGVGGSYTANRGFLVAVQPNTTYTVSLSNSEINYNHVTEYDSNKVSLGYTVKGSSTYSFTTKSNTAYVSLRFGMGNATSGATYSTTVQLELGSTATEYEPYTGGKPSPNPDYPQEIKVARGRNLLPYPYTTYLNTTSYGVTRILYPDGTITLNGTSTLDYNIVLLAVSSSVFGAASNGVDAVSALGEPGDYTVSTGTPYATIRVNLWRNGSLVNGTPYYGSTGTVVPIQSGDKIEVGLMVVNAATYSNLKVKPQIERGTSASPYCPYGHVGLDIYDLNDQHVSTIPIPLPSKGWAGGLPDGTADELAIDSAGKWEWTNETDEAAFNGGEAWLQDSSKRVFINFRNLYPNLRTPAKALSDRFIEETAGDTFNGKVGFALDNGNIFFANGTDPMSVSDWESWLSTNNVTVLYPLANPTTEHGYIDLPSIPEGATVTCPELADVGVELFVPGARELVEHADNWGRRAREAEARITALEQAIAELATS